MTLRKKTLLVFGLSVGGLVLALYAASSSVFLRGYADLERQYAEKDVRRAIDVLAREVDRLNIIAGDYAAWDDTCKFIADRNEAYIKANMTDETLTNLKTNVILYYNLKGELVFGKALDLQKEAEIQVPPSLVRHLGEDPRLRSHADAESSQRGLLVLPDYVASLASRPIVTSERTGPVRGTLIFVRFIDDLTVKELAEIAHLDMCFLPLAEKSAPPEFLKGAEDSSSDPTITVRLDGQERLVGMGLLRDVYGQPCLVTRVDAPRAIYRQGLATVRRFIWVLLGATVVFIALELFLLEWMVLNRVSRLSSEVNTVTSTGDPSKRVRAAGRDEIGRLADNINAMLATLQSSHEELQARQRELAAVNAELKEASLQAEAANVAKSQFLANMSHEIRTPMTAILGFSELMQDPNLTESERNDCVQTIQRNGTFLLDLINDILDLSKVESGKLDIEQMPCDLVKLVREVESLMRVRAAAKQLPLRVEYAGPVPETIRTDPTRLKQILMNLVGNAVKFTEKGLVRVVVRFQPAASPAGGGTIEIEVCDTGIGVTPEQLGRLFEPFHQADASTTRRFGGTGLGLAISQRLAEKMGGRISAESTYGVGSTFRLTLPTGRLDDVQMVDGPGPEPEPACEPQEPSLGTAAAAEGNLDCRILLAEDAPDSQRLIGGLLRLAGAEVVVVPNGQMAIEHVLEAGERGEPYDVVLMDVQMPIVDGYEATGRLRQHGYTGPIIAMTAHAMIGDREKSLAAGFDDHVVKPVNRRALFEAIRRQLDRCTAPAIG